MDGKLGGNIMSLLLDVTVDSWNESVLEMMLVLGIGSDCADL